MLTREQSDVRFANRRRIARQSFIIFSLVIVVLLGLGLTSDEMAQRVTALQWLVTVATGLWGALILGYYAAASYEQTRPSERPLSIGDAGTGGGKAGA